ncbi:MAG TPA: HDOD domain-containing protein [Marinagarivorans sp.]|nr:HDOD domain-containing protein [Cellvibrionaceae bacterium]HMY39698.1 HDOD domain-containing protein [Marinagarivorans sp.]HNG59693.1 HDOD domain-containing protein [Cellvibrionaceae bacterium]
MSVSPLFARQPIFTAKLEVVGYELLFRSSQQNRADFIDGDSASSHVLLYAFGEHRINDVIGDKKAFINFTRNLLLGNAPLPPEQLVIEILENITCDKLLLEALKEKKQQGYEFALDDFVLTKDNNALLPFASTIKVDVLNTSEAEITRIIRAAKPYAIRLLAEKIETHAMFKHCVELGFEWFQGYFLSKPQIVEGVKTSGNIQALLQLLASLMAPEVNIDTVCTAITSDARLTYKILKLANGASKNQAAKFGSIQQAVLLLGLNAIRNWATLLLLTSNDSEPQEIYTQSCARAKLCELIGQQIGDKTFAENCFTLGLLSTLDVYLKMPIKAIAQQLSLSEEMHTGLIKHTGKLGHVLAISLAIEQQQWAKVTPAASHYKIPERILSDCYIQAYQWANQIQADIKERH